MSKFEWDTTVRYAIVVPVGAIDLDVVRNFIIAMSNVGFIELHTTSVSTSTKYNGLPKMQLSFLFTPVKRSI